MSKGRRNDRYIADGGAEFVTECDPEESTVRAVSRSLAAIQDIAETDLDPLYTKLDFEALDQLLEHADRHGCSFSISFRIDEYTILVQEDGSMRINPDLPPPRSMDRK